MTVEGIVNSILQEHKIAQQSLNPRNSNEEYHFIRDCAMVKVCEALELPPFQKPEIPKELSDREVTALIKAGEQLAGLALYGHLPEAERPKILEAAISEESGKDTVAEERRVIIAEARRKLADGRAIPVITDAMEGRAYSGEIVEIGSAYAVQKIDDGRGIVHNLQYLKDFTRVLNESNAPYLEISYDRDMNGSVGAMKEAVGHDRSASMSR